MFWLSGCNEENHVESYDIPVIEWYRFTSIEYPCIDTKISNGESMVCNNLYEMEPLGSVINSKINFNREQIDTVTLLVHRQDVSYRNCSVDIKVNEDVDGKISVRTIYNLNSIDQEYEDRYVNLICIKIPKITALTNFTYHSAIKVIN